jgi:hypothetical protein
MNAPAIYSPGPIASSVLTTFPSSNISRWKSWGTMTSLSSIMKSSTDCVPWREVQSAQMSVKVSAARKQNIQAARRDADSTSTYMWMSVESINVGTGTDERGQSIADLDDCDTRL